MKKDELVVLRRLFAELNNAVQVPYTVFEKIMLNTTDEELKRDLKPLEKSFTRYKELSTKIAKLLDQ